MNNDPRSMKGILSRGANVYNGVGMSSKMGINKEGMSRAAARMLSEGPPGMNRFKK